MSPADLAKLLELPELPARLAQIDAALANIAAEVGSAFLREPLQRLVQPRGKRLRSALLLAVVAGARQPADERVVAACAAIELVHLASLAHDDIIDNAATRWSQPTIHAQEGPAAALLAGDYLLASASRQAATVGLEAVELIASTITTMCQGQAMELANLGNIKCTPQRREESMRAKTASLFAAACGLGGLAAGLPRQQITALQQYGEAFGLAHQLLDDILDFVSAEGRVGKPVGSDLRSGVYTLPVLLGLASPYRVKLQQTLVQKDAPATVLLLRHAGAFRQARERLDSYNQCAAATLAPLGDNAAALRSFPGRYTAWALPARTGA